MATTDHAIAISNEMSMELPTLPPNQGLEALKDVAFGSVSRPFCRLQLRQCNSGPELTVGF